MIALPSSMRGVLQAEKLADQTAGAADRMVIGYLSDTSFLHTCVLLSLSPSLHHFALSSPSLAF